ncbi:unnamed protein product, partial [Coregonus sp. 'balchen']
MYLQPDYAAKRKACNHLRNFADVYDSCGSVKTILDWTADHQDIIVPGAGMTLACSLGWYFGPSWSPLLMSNDLRDICPQSKQLLQNIQVILISQDQLGRQGYRTAKISLSGGQLALAVLDKQEIGSPRLPPHPGHMCHQVLPSYKELGVQTLLSKLVVDVNPSGTELTTVTPIK